MATAPNSTLAAIEQKVRRLTRSPSAAQLTTTDLENYINTYVVYDFPEHLRTFQNRTQFTFYTQPYQDVYKTDDTWPLTAQLYNFQNQYISMHSPVYIAGYNSWFSQSREQFFGVYPLTNSIQMLAQTGNGVQTNFTGFISSLNNAISPLNNGSQITTSLLQNNVLFSSIDVNGNGISLVDSPIVDSVSGFNTIYGLMYPPNNPPVTLPLTLSTPYMSQPGFPTNNYINYATGQFNITFPTAPATATIINSQTVPQVVSLPQALMYHNNQFTVRPVPDQPYAINFEVYQRPTYLMSAGSYPQLEELWQLIALGASRKIFQDRMDMDSVALIDPEYKLQERLCNRRTLVQYTNERTATIYTDQVGSGAGAYGSGFWQGGGSF